MRLGQKLLEEERERAADRPEELSPDVSSRRGRRSYSRARAGQHSRKVSKAAPLLMLDIVHFQYM